MKCPKCDGMLNPVQVKIRPEYGADILNDAEQTDSIALDQCLVCNGVWFDVKELDQYLAEKIVIIDSPKTRANASFENKKGVCPRCSVDLVKKGAPSGASFHMDVCPSCSGVWLDPTEIDRLEDKNISTKEKHALVWRYFLNALKGKGA